MKLIHVGLSVLTSTCKSAKEANVHVFSTENQIKMILSKIRSAGGNTLGIGLPALKKKINYKNKSLLLHTQTGQIYSHCFGKKITFEIRSQ